MRVGGGGGGGGGGGHCILDIVLCVCRDSRSTSNRQNSLTCLLFYFFCDAIESR